MRHLHTLLPRGGENISKAMKKRYKIYQHSQETIGRIRKSNLINHNRQVYKDKQSRSQRAIWKKKRDNNDNSY